MDVINGMFIGVCVGIVIAIPATIAVLAKPGMNLPILIDVNACWGRRCTSLEVYLLSLFTHLLVAAMFGGGYVFLAVLGVGVHNFTLATILGYALVFLILTGLVLFPLVGLGVFARREGRHTWLELLESHALLAVGFWLACKLFPVFLP